MTISPISNPISGEQVLKVEPAFNSTPDNWNKRLNLFTGRSLSDLALQAEQDNRSGRLALLGRLRSAGVVSGLQVTDASDESDRLRILIAAGQGLTRSGEDVWVPRPHTVSLLGLPVFQAAANSPSLRDFLVNGSLQDVRTFILLLQPVVLPKTDSADPSRCTDWDDSSRAFENEQRIDGVRLALHPWESGLKPGDGDGPLRWRNLLANKIFREELISESDHNSPAPADSLSWKHLGLPIALIALTADRQAIEFIDGFAVVRAGGRPRARAALVPNAGNPLIWQARLQQFAEQLAEIEPQGTALAEHQSWIQSTVAPRFRFLPPVGLLPAAALAPRANRENQNFFFPANYSWQVAPIPMEQLELVLKDSASLAPFDLDQADQVQVWVPVPQAWFEPNLLQVEPISPLFQQRIEEFQSRRAEWLYRRTLVRARNSAITKSITGKLPVYPVPDPNSLPDEDLAPFSSTKVLQSPDGGGLYLFKQEIGTLPVNSGDTLFLYVWIDPTAGPTSIEVWWYVDQVLSRRAIWGNASVEDLPTQRLMGAVPDSGEWVRLEIPASLLNLEGSSLLGLAVRVQSGRIAWGHVGKRAAQTGVETVWMGDSLPAGAIADPLIFRTNAGWSWLPANQFGSLATQLELMVAREVAKRQKPFTVNRALVSNIATGVSIYALKGATAGLPVVSGDSLSVYVYLDPIHLPERIEIWWLTNDNEPNAQLRRAYWGTPSLWGREFSEDQGPMSRLAVGRWVKLQIAAATLRLEGSTITGMVFGVTNGRAAWAQAGKSVTVEGSALETVWLDSDPPLGAAIRSDQGWAWVTLTNEETPLGDPLPALLQVASLNEEDYGTSDNSANSSGTRIVTTLESLRSRLVNQTPIDNDAVTVSKWPEGTPGKPMPIPAALSNKVSYDPVTRLMTVKGILSDGERDQLIQLSANLSPDKLSQSDKDAIKAAINDLCIRSKDNTDLDILDQKGLQAFIGFLESKVAQADDAVEFGFLQSRTNMYRIRQQVLGQADASRLATSSTLADIATRESAYATQKDLSEFFQASKGRVVPVPVTPRASVSRAAVEPPPAEGVAADAAASLRRERALNALTESPVSSGLDTSTTFPTRSAGVRAIGEAALGLRAGSVTGASIGATAQPLKSDLQFTAISAADNSLLFRPQFNKDDVIGQSPIVGSIPDSVIIGERLKQPAAIETLDFSKVGRKDVVDNLALLGIFKDLPVPGAKNNLNFGQITPGRSFGLDDDPPEPKPGEPQADEVEFFSRSVLAIDRTVAALRLAEGRVQAYRQAIAFCQQTLAELQGLQGQINQRLQVVETELAEARQDVSVSKALLAEETARVGRINERRDRILSEHVTFLAYQRPRSANLLVTPPWRSLDPGFVADPLPPCLNDDQPIPRELRAMTDLLREAPLSWFSSLPQGLDRIDRVDSLVRLFESALQRNNPGFGASVDVATITTGSTQISQTIRGIYGQSQQLVQQNRRLIERIDLNAIAAQSWRQSRQQAEKILTLGDLLDGNHRRPELSNQAATLLEQLSRVATCLHTGFAAVKPALRLDWAERLSQFDEPVNLRALSNLPRWGEIDVLDRRELQSLVDWLFQQLSSSQAEAVRFLSDLIRLSLLLACHAPVNQIISGNVVKPTTVQPGGTVQIIIDPLQVRIGMPVLVYSQLNTVVARGIVEDLNGGLAAAKITQTTAVNVTLNETTRVQFLRKALL